MGIQGEDNALVYTADVSDWLAQWPDGVVALVLQAPDRSAPYVANTSLDTDTGIITWTITRFDTAIVGYGVGELRIVTDDVVKKSYRFATYVRPSVLASAGDPPAPVPDWVTELIQSVERVLDGTQENAKRAEAAQAAAEAAAQAADTSADRAEQAAQDAGYMDFCIDDHGNLIYQRTDNVDIDFELREGSLIALWQ